MLSAAIASLFLLPLFSDIALVDPLALSPIAGIAAIITTLLSVVAYIIAPKDGSSTLPFTVYLFFLATAGIVVNETGGIGSPFIALWSLVSFFSVIFSVWAVLAVITTSGLYVAIQYLEGSLDMSVIIVVGLVSLVPVAASILVWRHRDNFDDSNRNVRKLTNELSEVASKSEIVINAIGDGVVAVDSMGVIQLINPAAQELLGWGKQDAMMLNYKSVLKMIDGNNHEVESAQDPIAQVLNTNQLVRQQNLTVLTKSGKKMIAAMVVSPVGETGSGAIAVFRDVTKETSEGREQAEFISTASHEMRTPVASIEGYLGLAMNAQTATIDPRAREYITRAHEAAEHLGRLFQDLLDVSKSEDGRLTNIPKVVDLSPFTEKIVQGLTEKAKDKGLELVFVPSSQRAQRTIVPVYFVNQDNDHIREVLNNLIENAIKYTPKGTVRVDIEGDDDKVTVSIKDSGLGIPAEDLPHLFQKFYRVNNSDRQEIGGTGLGLYLSRRLAEAMQGRLWVESVHGQGSTFFLELPRITTEEAERLKLQQANQPTPSTTNQPTPFPSGQHIDMHSGPHKPPLVSAKPTGTEANPEPVVSDRDQTGQPIVAPQPQTPVQPQPQPTTVPTPVAPAKEVPRGQSLTREEIADRVRQLEAMAKETPPPETEQPPTTGQPQP